MQVRTFRVHFQGTIVEIGKLLLETLIFTLRAHASAQDFPHFVLFPCLSFELIFFIHLLTSQLFMHHYKLCQHMLHIVSEQFSEEAHQLKTQKKKSVKKNIISDSKDLVVVVFFCCPKTNPYFQLKGELFVASPFASCMPNI